MLPLFIITLQAIAIMAFSHLFARSHIRLIRLRRNCFLTNERGHRVRYWNASESVRERAEG